MDEPARAAAPGVELLERAVAYTLGCLQSISADVLSRPTPCRGWDLHTLLKHMDESLTALCDAADLGRIDLDQPVPGPAAEIVARLKVKACRLLGWSAEGSDTDVISVDGHPLTVGVVTATGALEIAVHGWDVAQACASARPLPAELAEALLSVSVHVVGEADRPARFASPIAIPPLSSGEDRLLAFLGRRPCH